MRTFATIFLMLCAILAVEVMILIVAGWLIDLFGKKKKEEPVVEPQPVVEPEPEPEPEPVVEPEPEPVVEPELEPVALEEITAELANKLVSDDVAESFVIYEDGVKTKGPRTFINLGDIDKNFEANDVITIDVLKEKKLISTKMSRVKILADGVLTKPLTVKAHAFSIEAVKMIGFMGGTVVKLP